MKLFSIYILSISDSLIFCFLIIPSKFYFDKISSTIRIFMCAISSLIFITFPTIIDPTYKSGEQLFDNLMTE